MNDYGNSAAVGGVIAGMMMTIFMIFLVIGLFVLICMWRIFTKAGKPGWACIVPFYNFIVMLDIVGKPAWWLILMFIPFANFIVAIIVNVRLAKSFGKDVGFAIGLILLPIIFLPILAFSDAQYIGPNAADMTDSTVIA